MKLLFCLLLLLAAQPLAAQVTLRARVADGDVVLPRSVSPLAGGPDAALAKRLSWKSLRPGLESAAFVVDAGRLGMNVRIIVARIDPRHFDFSLVHRTAANRMTGTWNVDVAPRDAAVALNAGQFKETGPWGWLVLDGYEHRDPGYGPLSTGIAIDTAGTVRWLDFEQLPAARNDRSIRFAFQSYPTLLLHGRVPPLARSRRAIEQEHRDARLVLAQDRAGRLLVVLTRYDALGGAVARVPIGLTVPETIVLVNALGAHHAVMLDGGVSAQLLMRNELGETDVWRGMRNVPLALIATPRVH